MKIHVPKYDRDLIKPISSKYYDLSGPGVGVLDEKGNHYAYWVRDPLGFSEEVMKTYYPTKRRHFSVLFSVIRELGLRVTEIRVDCRGRVRAWLDPGALYRSSKMVLEVTGEPEQHPLAIQVIGPVERDGLYWGIWAVP